MFLSLFLFPINFKIGWKFQKSEASVSFICVCMSDTCCRYYELKWCLNAIMKFKILQDVDDYNLNEYDSELMVIKPYFCICSAAELGHY